MAGSRLSHMGIEGGVYQGRTSGHRSMGKHKRGVSLSKSKRGNKISVRKKASKY